MCGFGSGKEGGGKVIRTLRLYIPVLPIALNVSDIFPRSTIFPQDGAKEFLLSLVGELPSELRGYVVAGLSWWRREIRTCRNCFARPWIQF